MSRYRTPITDSHLVPSTTMASPNPPASPPASHMMTLFCLVFGDAEPFPLDISGDQLVAHLKDSIVAKKPNRFQGLDADELKLWKPTTTLNDEDESLQQFNLTSALKMWPSHKIRKYWTDPPCDCIHIVIEVPGK